MLVRFLYIMREADQMEMNFHFWRTNSQDMARDMKWQGCRGRPRVIHVGKAVSLNISELIRSEMVRW